MHLLFISFLVYGTIVKANSELKYIDLLPEKEKEEFLEKIARRILEEVETRDDVPNGSGEIPDEQLNEQDAFVRRLLKEEAESFNKQVNATEVYDAVNATDSNMLHALRDEDENKGERYIDLTLRADNSRMKRENNRRVFTGFAPDSETKNVDTSSVNSSESDIDIQVKNFKKSTEFVDETTIIEKNNETTPQTAYDSTNNTENNSKEFTAAIGEENANITKTLVFKTQDDNNGEEIDVTTEENSLIIVNLTTDKKESNENIKTTTSSDNPTETDTTTLKNSGNFFTAEVTASESVKYEDVQKTFNPFGNFSSNGSKNENKEKMNDDLQTGVTPRVETAKTFPNSSKASESDEERLKLESMQSENPNTEMKKPKDSEVINIKMVTVQTTKRTTFNDDIPKYKENSFTKRNVKRTATEVEVLTPKPPENRESKNDVKSTSSQTDQVKSDLETILGLNVTADDVVKALRESLIINGKLDKNPDDKNHEIKKPREYRVFEIASDVSPFVKQELPQQQPIQTGPELPKTLLNLQQLDSLKFNKQQKPTIFQVNIPHPNPIQLSELKPKPLHLKRPQPVPIQLNRQKPKLNTQEPKTIQLNKEQHLKLLQLGAKQVQDRKVKISQPEPAIFESEEPYHVPIYSYVPKNAFFNPHNIYGPNADSNDDDDDKTAEEKDESTLPSPLPSEENSIQIKKAENNEQPFYVRVYNYSPNNAFYNPYNHFGPDLGDKDTKLQEKHVDDDSDYDSDDYNYTTDKRNDDRDQMEWQYYYDPLKAKNKLDSESELKKKKVQNDHIVNPALIQMVKNLIEIGKEKTSSNDDLDWENTKSKAYLRCLYKQKCGQVEMENNNKKMITDNDDLGIEDTETFANTMSKMRHMMLVSGHFMLVKPENTSRFDSYFASAEKDDSESKENEKGKQKAMRTVLIDDKKVPQGSKTILTINENEDENAISNEKIERFMKLKTLIIDPLKQIYQESLAKKEAKEDKNALRFESAGPKKESDKLVEYKMVKEMADLVDDPEILATYIKLESLHLRTGKRNEKISQELDVFVEVLGDMVKDNNKALLQYDWLGSAVDLQSAVKKMSDMVEAAQNDEDIHPSDLELLKYVVYLHTFAKDELNLSLLPAGLRGLKVPPGKRHQSRGIIKERGLLYRQWLIRFGPNSIPHDELQEFHVFLNQLQDSLYQFHTAIKYIAIVTKYKNQRWFENLKQIHLDSNRKSLLELILHLCTTRLLGMIEESAKNGLEDNFLLFVKRNEKEVLRTKDEFIFVLKLVEELKNI